LAEITALIMPVAKTLNPVAMMPTVDDCFDQLTLRDWFAGQVIAAMIGSDAALSAQRDENGRHCGFNASRLANMATNAYQAAEALIQARAQFASNERPRS
jgi:hypothetical protein